MVDDSETLKRAEVIKRNLSNMGDNYQGLYKKVTSGEAGYAGAVKAKCQECMNYEDAVQRIRECSVYGCPLWHYRPYQEKRSRSEKEEITTELDEGRE